MRIQRRWLRRFFVLVGFGVGAGLAAFRLSAAGAPGPEPVASGRELFAEVTTAAGIGHVHRKPRLDPKLDPIMPWMSAIGAAACTADVDGDGLLDLFATNSAKGAPNFLYHNNGDGTFTEVGARAGVAAANDESGVAVDCVFGDVDNDGWPDLFIARWGRSLLFRNRGDGTFVDVTAARFRRADGTPGTDWKNSAAAVFLDYDRDGRLDLYLGNYFRDDDLWHLATTRIMHDSFETARNGGVNQLFHQEADGTFTEVAGRAGVDDSGWTLAVGSADVDNDGWPDLYVADDFGADQLFLNRGDGTFTGLGSKALGVDTRKGMNVDFGDFNGDGWLDVYVTNITASRFLREGNMLWLNNGAGADGGITFTDVSAETGTFDGGWGWGAKFFDADGDGDLDIVAANGFVSAGEGDYWMILGPWRAAGHDPADAANWPPMGDRSFSGFEALRFFENRGLGSFVERAQDVGLVSDRDNRGLVVFDYDNDGDLDVYVANQGQAPQLFRNGGVAGNHWLSVALVGDPAHRTTRDAVGARVTLRTAAGQMLRERDGGNGFAGQSDPRLHFGLGASDKVEVLEVRWPDGGCQVLEGVAADQRITVRQDPARYVPGRLATPRVAPPAAAPPPPR